MFKCNLCTKTFSLRGNFQRHMNSKHTSNMFHCNQCKKAFSRRDNLIRHIRRMHITSSLCETCGEQFNNVCGHHVHSMQAIPNKHVYNVTSINTSTEPIMQTILEEQNKHINIVSHIKEHSVIQDIFNKQTGEVGYVSSNKEQNVIQAGTNEQTREAGNVTLNTKQNVIQNQHQ